MTHVISFTDGASSGNPGPAGWGAVVASGKSEKGLPGGDISTVEEIGGSIENGTNNEAELIAAINVLQNAKSKKSESVTIYTDSSYLIDGATGWIYGWQKNGWKTQNGDTVKNQDLWKQIISLQEDMSVFYEKVSGHAGVPANERADDIATDFAARSEPDLYSGAGDDYGIPLQPQTEEIPGSPVYLSCVDDVVKEHASWPQCKRRVNGEDAQYRKVHTRREKQQVLKEWGKTSEDITD